MSQQIPPLRPVTASDSILVVAPHPDDESLCCGGFIHKALRAGAALAIAWITNGDGFAWNAMVVEKTLLPGAEDYLALGRRRTGEARAAAALLGVPADRQFFLGYPDAGLQTLVLDAAYAETAWRSPKTGASAVAYADTLSPGAPHTGASLERDLTAVVQRVQPTLVLAPSTADRHTDHQAVGTLVARIMQARGEADRVHSWIVHGGDGWPSPKGNHPELPWTIPPRGASLAWERVDLDAAALAAKRAAIRAHVTQTTITPRFMASYLRATEIFARPV